MRQNNKEYCRNWHAKNRERSRELAKEYYQRISKPIEPLKPLKEVTEKLRSLDTYLSDKVIQNWNKKDWKIYLELTD